jgi:hypothetical protein
VAAGLIDGTVRTPTVKLPVGSGSREDETPVVVRGAEVAIMAGRVEGEAASARAVVAPPAVTRTAVPIPAAIVLVRVRIRCFIVMPPVR